MHERIKELARQAAAIEGWGPEVWQTTFTEKFAKLIVKEVLDVIDRERFEIYPPVLQRVREHFGVE